MPHGGLVMIGKRSRGVLQAAMFRKTCIPPTPKRPDIKANAILRFRSYIRKACLPLRFRVAQTSASCLFVPVLFFVGAYFGANNGQVSTLVFPSCSFRCRSRLPLSHRKAGARRLHPRGKLAAGLLPDQPEEGGMRQPERRPLSTPPTFSSMVCGRCGKTIVTYPPDQQSRR